MKLSIIWLFSLNFLLWQPIFAPQADFLLKPSSDYLRILSSHDLDFERDCDLKQGFLGYVTDNKFNNKIDSTESLLKPVFVVLNTKFLSIFENENATSLIKSIDLRYIQTPERLQQINKEFVCFQILLNPKGP